MIPKYDSLVLLLSITCVSFGNYNGIIWELF